MSASRVELAGICKSYPGVRALEDVDFELRAGEIHALAGTNGAGKSTLVRVLGGVERPDAGSVSIDGVARRFRGARDALGAGVAVLHQETHLVPDLSVTENFFLGRERRRGIGLDWRGMRAETRARLAELGLELDVDRPARSLPVAHAQLVGLARAIDLEARFLVLDEPTSSLDRGEVQRLFELLRGLRERGLGILFIGHALEQVYELCERVTVLREGRNAGTFALAELPRVELVARMLGRRDAAGESAAPARSGSRPVALSARGLSRRGAIEAFDLELREGEVLGLAGLLGSGRTELARLLYAADAPDSGELRVGSRRPKSPRQSIEAGVAFCGEDRKTDGLFPNLSVAENVAVASLRRTAKHGVLSPRAIAELAKRLGAELGLVAASVEQPAGTLSGGNQQKVLLARALACEPKVLILDEPTRGIDVGAKLEVERLVAHVASRGTAVVFVSAELAEVLRRSARVLVLRERRVVLELEGEAIGEPRVMEALAGGAPRG